MNPLLQKLAEDAGIDVKKLTVKGSFPNEEALALQTFAEAIALECVWVCIHELGGTISDSKVAGYMAAGRVEAARLITQHFDLPITKQRIIERLEK